MHNILLEIIEKKKQDLIEKKNPLSSLRAVARQSRENQHLLPTTRLRPFNEDSPFVGLHQFRLVRNDNNIGIIAEIKLSSPTIASLGSKCEIIDRAIAYEKAGADAISLITEKHYFNGDISFIPKIKEKISLPILQKDFIIDEYQIYEAKNAGSDALLLIVRYLDTKTLQHFVSLCQKLHIEPVVEINDEEDLAKAIATTTNIIAVNARDLRTFEIDVDKACKLLKKIPNTFIRLGFSGIHSAVEVKKYKEAGVKGVLVGTELMKAKNIDEFINDLKNI